MPDHPERPRRYPKFRLPEENPNEPHFADEFVIPSKDEDGKSERVQCRLSSKLHNWVIDIVQSRKFPFRGEGDLMRFGVYTACRLLSRIEPAVASMQGLVDASNALMRHQELQGDVTEHMEKLTETVRGLERKRAWGPIVMLIREDRRLAEQALKLEPYWGQQWLDQLNEHFTDIEARAMSKLEDVDFKMLLPSTDKLFDHLREERDRKDDPEGKKANGAAS